MVLAALGVHPSFSPEIFLARPSVRPGPVRGGGTCTKRQQRFGRPQQAAALAAAAAAAARTATTTSRLAGSSAKHSSARARRLPLGLVGLGCGDAAATPTTTLGAAAEEDATAVVEVLPDGGVLPPRDEAQEEDEESGAADSASAEESADRVARSMGLLEQYTAEKHPGHQPGRFVGPGPEFDGMEFDGLRWRMKKDTTEGSQRTPSTALARMSEADRSLATTFEAEGGLALCLGHAFSRPDRLRREARRILEAVDNGTVDELEDVEDPELDAALEDLRTAKLGLHLQLLDGASPMERGVLLMHAADVMEEREAVMRNVWSDVEFHGGAESNAELVSRLERQFASQLVRTADARLKAKDEAKRNEKQRQQPQPDKVAEPSAVATAEAAVAAAAATVAAATAHAADDVEKTAEDEGEGREADGIFDLALRGSEAEELAQRLPEEELTATLLEPRNLGVALDLVGVYLKNYEIDKADLVINRVVPLCRQRGGTWLVKGLDKMSAVRMKQFRAYDALKALREIEGVVPFAPEEGWEFHDILYRNLAWCYSALDEAERCLEYTRKSVEVKKSCGIPATWFDIWDLGKAHARIGQKTKQREEMKMAYDLCLKAAEIHRTAEPHDRIMLAKVLSNIGEVAMGVGDSFHLEGQDDEARPWYEKAEPSLEESYRLHYEALGPLKPLAGWAAGTMAHCLVRLERWDDARKYLAMALKVECTKDSQTPGSVIELIDRVLGVHNRLGQLQSMAEYAADFDECLVGLRQRGWDVRERDVFALLLQKIATVLLAADSGTGNMIPKALEKLKEAETSLNIHLGGFEDSSKTYSSKAEAHSQADEAPVDPALSTHEGAPDVEQKTFGPQANAPELLQEVRSTIRILELSKPGDASAVNLGYGDQKFAKEIENPSSASTPRGNLTQLDDAAALAMTYALAGNWNDWSAFVELRQNAQDKFEAEIEVPEKVQVIEFQVICNGDWDQRIFPVANGAAIGGPSGGGHGQNWKLRAATGCNILRVSFDPTGSKRLDFSLHAVSPSMVMGR